MLIKSAEFYLQPSHVDKVVGICLYDCRFWLPGVQEDWVWTKHWDAIRNEVTFKLAFHNNTLLFIGMEYQGVSDDLNDLML